MANQQRPNFLFITTDQQRWDAMGHNNPHIRTPAMDSLARGRLALRPRLSDECHLHAGPRQHDHGP